VSISQYGLVRSLNVSIAASIVMYEYMRQWRGMRLAGI
jgi:tRNA G18 (ribose-2'-O)-methylase SpoU